ncbi:MetQ/NlpA family ABC transporter substrate-binding protein [Anaerosphaera multitolerans]|uniref:Lipoprotein n=1 Tax=Anaerosphaera multitolerans TaxID=2487351 RepID=A0A437S7Y2_9FIRM|nr:MetQ/NlpA family ABC transporter substrate-binding protein [Anaerosphaera multitolerans]RVU55041.1 MetQ/NlpA family ABC transporter substrate-binding protein [Anaerosphaera multitolerans]
MKKKLLVSLLAVAILLVGCSKNEPAKEENTANTGEPVAEASENKIVIGVSPTPHGEIIENLLPKFEEAGLEVEIVNYDDYVQPNLQLDAGDLDANYFQHGPYLETFNKENNLDLVSIGSVHIEPMGVYSKDANSIDEIAEGSDVIIPNDAANGGRALLLLEKEGLIKLKDSTNILSTEQDIVENPKNITIVPMDAQNIPNVYEDAGAAVINSNFAIGAGLNPTKDTIALEAGDSPYTNVVAVRAEDKDLEKFKTFMEIVQSEETEKFIEEKYEGAVIAAFDN